MHSNTLYLIICTTIVNLKDRNISVLHTEKWLMNIYTKIARAQYTIVKWNGILFLFYFSQNQALNSISLGSLNQKRFHVLHLTF